MEALTALLCLLPCMLFPIIGFGVWMGLNAGQKNTQRVEEQTAALEQLGLKAVDASDWRLGDIDGQPVAVKAYRTAKVRNFGEQSGVNLGVKLAMLVPIDVELAQHLFRNNPGKSAKAFERHFYQGAGKPPAGVPEPVRDALMAWLDEAPGDRVEVGPRSSASLYAGRMFRDATTLVRIEGAGRLEADELEAWLRECVRRVGAMAG